MTRRLFVLIFVSLALVGAVVFGIFQRNQSRLLRLEGSITNVRIRPLSDGANLVILDFQATNPSPVGFELENIAVDIPAGPNEVVRGGVLDRAELRGYMEYEKLPMPHPLLGIGAAVASGESVRGTVAARFESVTPVRGVLFRLRLRDINHRESVLETPSPTPGE